MPDRERGYGTGGVGARLRAVVQGRDDTRFRATWRVLLVGLLAFPLTEAVSVRVAGALGSRAPVVVGTVQAATFAVLLVAWARYVDRRALADYGFAAAPSWLADLLVGFGAVFAGFGLWFAVEAALGWSTVTVALSAPSQPVAVGLSAALVAFGLNAWVQETVFRGLVLQNVAEGVHARAVGARRAVLVAFGVVVVYFVVIHGVTRPRFVLDLAVAGAVFSALYVHTGSLALPVGAHVGANFVGGTVFLSPEVAADRAAVFVVSGGVPGVDLLNMAYPKMVVAYVLLLGWLRLRHGEVGVEADIAEWTER